MKWMTTSEVADFLGLSTDRVTKMAKQGRLGLRMADGRFIYDRGEVEEFAKKARPAGRPKKEEENG